jgi:hypothetical protein
MSLTKIVYHGANKPWNGPPRIAADRGMFFSTDPNYALDYGSTIYKARVTLNNPLAYSELQAQGTMVLDRRKAMALGYDGRVIQYDDGNMDVIAFSPEQIEVLDMVRVKRGVWPPWSNS